MLPGLIGTFQATEALKLLLQLGSPPLGLLSHYRALDSSFRSLKLKKNPRCRSCGPSADITSPIDYSTAPTAKMTSIPEISTSQLRDLLSSEEEFELLDVREDHEWEQAHIEGARLLPLSLWPSLAEPLERDARYLMLCAAGVRSLRAARWMVDHGFTNVTNIQGGMSAWQQENP